MTQFDEIQAKLATITPGPWHAEPETRKTFPGYSIECADPSKPERQIAVAYNVQMTADAQFIAAAPDMVAYLLDSVRNLSRVLEVYRVENESLHKKVEQGDLYKTLVDLKISAFETTMIEKQNRMAELIAQVGDFAKLYKATLEENERLRREVALYKQMLTE